MLKGDFANAASIDLLIFGNNFFSKQSSIHFLPIWVRKYNFGKKKYTLYFCPKVYIPLLFLGFFLYHIFIHI